ncbi:hypothetical protein [Pseudoalteromonas rubra]|uniref:RES domain-containing protein n=1 Tax=Pseudoalteromonas rubra TaxID=43658 RepID=A0A5S3WSC0_9GAMM|nr:hypothetical protein [Pseudoalteromonas rubra]TMP31203.1 hypothetical protein CWB98_22095 [Pseudoalteromonas rubra]
MDENVIYKKYLDEIDSIELHRKIDGFRRLNFRSMNSDEVRTAIFEVLKPNGGPVSVIALERRVLEYPKGTRVFRVRGLPKEDCITPFKTITAESHLWNPPPSISKAQRLNIDGESVFYGSTEPFIAMEEARIGEGEYFCLGVFEALMSIRAPHIGFDNDIPSLSSDQQLKHRMITDFFAHEFIRDVGVGTEHLYKISRCIAYEHFELPENLQDAWCFPSSFDKTKVNMCLRSNKAEERLGLHGMVFCQKTGFQNFSCLEVGIANEEKTFKYFPLGSDEQKLYFPEIGAPNGG